MQRFRGRLVFMAHRLCVSLNSRLESNKEEEGKAMSAKIANSTLRYHKPIQGSSSTQTKAWFEVNIRMFGIVCVFHEWRVGQF